MDPNSDFGKLKRVANSQKCIRAGGKHNDLEDVGKDEYHHTFFEMLGNWSFGDYFKKEAITMAWNLLTKEYGLDPERLYFTYFQGEPTFGLPADLEAKALWESMGVPSSRVLPFGMKENFWEMGESGPCGPCSEIHYDRIGGRDASAQVNLDDPTVLEIWNLVFMQFNRELDGTLRPLPNKHVDTGMGFERLVSVLQDKRSNYDTDVFGAIFEAITERTGVRPYTGLVGTKDIDGIDTAYRVIADHIRTLTIALSDGGIPSNEGRGYVLRRILRRAVRYSHEKLGAPSGFFASLVPVVVAQLGEEFTELTTNPQRVMAILDEEEKQFRKTLEKGIKQFNKIVGDLKKRSESVLPGDMAWKLSDTFGFPLDLTRLMAEEHGFKVDEAAYEVEQEEAKEMSRRGKSDEDSGSIQSIIDAYKLTVHQSKMLEHILPTDDSLKYDEDSWEMDAKITAIYSLEEEALLSRVEADYGEERPLAIILDKTCFYAEAGGQQSDMGKLSTASAFFKVLGVQAFSGHVIHLGVLLKGTLSLNEIVHGEIDTARRHPLMLNHTATHMLNFAIQATLPLEAIDQKGSLVAPDRLRFDYSLGKAPSTEELASFEAVVNKNIQENLHIYHDVVPLAQAKSINGLRAVFGETYPDPVRVVAVGFTIAEILRDPSSPRWKDTSIELCGGTHLSSTGPIEAFVILTESSIAKGIRRIIALTGDKALEARQVSEEFKARLISLERLSFQSNFAEIDYLLKSLTKELETLDLPLLDKLNYRLCLTKQRALWDDQDKARKAAELKKVTDDLSSLVLSDNSTVIKVFPVGANTKALNAGLQVCIKSGQAAFLYSLDADTVYFYVHVPETLVKKVSAIDWINKALESLAEGPLKAGGKPTTAQGSCILKDRVSDQDIFMAISSFAPRHI